MNVSKSEKVVVPDEVWDPVGQKITRSEFASKNKKIQEKLKKYTENPKLPLRNLLLFSIPGILTLIAFIFFYEPILKSAEGDNFYFLLFSFVPVFVYWGRVRKLQKDLIKFMVAKENHWFYDPNESISRWNNFENFVPEFFRKGDEGQNLQDEFWGKFQGKKRRLIFIPGCFSTKSCIVIQREENLLLRSIKRFLRFVLMKN